MRRLRDRIPYCSKNSRKLYEDSLAALEACAGDFRLYREMHKIANYEGFRSCTDAIARAKKAEAELTALRNTVSGAASGKVVAIGTDETGQPRALIHGETEDISRGPPIAYKRVALVVLDD